MKEGASNCVERHLNLNDCDTSLLWTYSQVGHKCCFHSQRITPRAACKRTYVRVYTALARGDSKLRFTIAAMEQEREGEIERLRKRQVTSPHRTAKRSRLLEHFIADCVTYSQSRTFARVAVLFRLLQTNIFPKVHIIYLLHS